MSNKNRKIEKSLLWYNEIKTIGGIFMAREYWHIKLYEKEILEMKSRGATKQEIDKYWKNFDLLMSRYTILLLDIIGIKGNRK